MKELPVEIFDFFVEHLLQDTEALKSCSLVCREWSLLFQQHLFSNLVVGKDEDGDVDRCRRLLELVSDSQHLASHFHHVQLFVSFTSPDWLILGRDLLPQLLSRLPQVRSLELRSDSIRSAFSQLPDDLRLSICLLVSTPSFQKLELWGWEFVPSAKNLVDLLQCCKRSLTSLGLSLISYDDKSKQSNQCDDSKSPYVELHKLKEISFIGSGSFPYYRIFGTPNVDTVFWPLHRSNEGLCRSTLVLQGLPDPVPHWKFYIHDGAGCEGVNIRMCDALRASSFAYLRRLYLSIDCYTSSNFAVRSITYLRQLLPFTQLESITIECLVNCDGLCGPAIWDRQHWELFCDSLIPLFKVLPAESTTLVFRVERCQETGETIGPHDPSDLEKPSEPENSVSQPVQVPIAHESGDESDEDPLDLDTPFGETNTQFMKKQVAETRRLMKSRFQAAGFGEIVQMYTQFFLPEFEW